MNHPLMPKATAVWLVENTALSFEQIADFCGLHTLEVNAIADDEVVIGMQGMNPISAGDLTMEEIERCQADTQARLKPAPNRSPITKKKVARYTPVSKRQDRPDAIAWLLKNYPEMTDPQISKLIGTTKTTIKAIRDRTHWNTTNIKAQNPISLGLCSADDLEKIVVIARTRASKIHKPNIVTDTTTSEVDHKEFRPTNEPTAATAFKSTHKISQKKAGEIGSDSISLPDSEIQPADMSTNFKLGENSSEE